jgi:hypothetical protein
MRRVSIARCRAPELGLAALLLCWPRAAQGQPAADIALDWQAPAECPDQNSVLDETARILRGTTATTRVAARAVVERDVNGSWRVSLETETESGTGRRDVLADSCPAVASAVALILALVVDPNAVLAEPEPASEPPPPPARPPFPVRAAPPTAPPPKKAEPSTQAPSPLLRPLIGVGPTLSFGTLPEVGLGARLYIGAELALRWLLLLEGALFLPHEAGLDARQGGRFDAQSLGLRGGFLALANEQAALGVLGGVELWRLHGAGYGVSSPRAVEAWFGAAFVGARLELRPARTVRLALDGNVGLPSSRARFELDELGTVHRVGAAIGGATLSASFVL